MMDFHASYLMQKIIHVHTYIHAHIYVPIPFPQALWVLKQKHNHFFFVTINTDTRFLCTTIRSCSPINWMQYVRGILAWLSAIFPTQECQQLVRFLSILLSSAGLKNCWAGKLYLVQLILPKKLHSNQQTAELR